MSAAMQFVLHARRMALVDEDQAPPPRENTILRFCNAECHELMPHYVQVGHLICVGCLNKVITRGGSDERSG